MDGSVQIVDQLGTDSGLSQDEFDRGQRIARVAVEHCKEGEVFVNRLKTFVSDCQRTGFREARKGFHGPLEKLPDLCTGFTALVSWKPLSGVGQQELVTLFHGLTAIRNF